MSWRDDLRPGSFRGVGFEGKTDGERGGMRGAHHVYPSRDQGWVQQLGLDDDRITVDGYLIGDDVQEQRARLRAALKTPGSGELIHPDLGPLQVTVDPSAGWSFQASTTRKRVVRISLNFLIAPAVSTAPDAVTDGPAATDAAAEAVEESIVDTIATRLDLDGIDAVISDARASMDSVFTEVGKARALAQRIAVLPGNIIATALAPLAEVRSLASDLIGIGDAFAGLGAMLDGVSIGISGRSRFAGDQGSPGARPAVRLPNVVTVDNTGIRRAALAALDRQTVNEVTTPQIAGNREALGDAFDIALVCELARASARESYSAHGEAIEAMRVVDARIERQIRTEADRLSPDDSLVQNLTDLRHASREAILASAANLAPIATVSMGESLPVLAAAWRIHGDIEGADDLIARNAISHPLWAPVEFDTLLPGGRNV